MFSGSVPPSGSPPCLYSKDFNKWYLENDNLSKIFVLEDCAQSLGAHAFGIPGSSQASLPEGCYKLGTFGDIGTFSLQLNKDITAGEGGMVVTRDKDLNDRVDALHNAGYIKKEN